MNKEGLFSHLSPEELRQLVEQAQAPKEIKLTPEVIKQSQAIYDFLGIKVDLQKEYQAGNIILPTPEQEKAAKQAGYTLGLIFPVPKIETK